MKLHNDDKGYAVAFALGAIVLVTIIAMTSYALAQRSIDQAGTESFSNRAYQVAASALEYEATLFEKSRAPFLLPGETVPANGTFLSPGRTLPGTNEKYDFSSTTSKAGVILKCTATRGGKTESVSVEEISIDLANSVYSGGGGGSMIKMINTKDSMIIGPLYLKVNPGDTITPNAGISFIDGPLYIENGKLDASGNVKWLHTSNVLHYEVKTDNAITGLDSTDDVIVSPLGPKMTTPSITPELVASLKSEAQAFMPSQYYEGDTTFGGVGGVLDASPNGTIFVNGKATVLDASASRTFFINGKATVDAAVTRYKGVFTIYATNGITVNGRLIPENFTNPDDHTSSAGVDTSYRDVTSSLGKDDGVSLPQVNKGYCATLISSGPILSTWAGSNSNGSSANFGFCGAMFTSGSVTFKSSLRGSIISSNSEVTGLKIILATQGTLGGYLPGPVNGSVTGPGSGPVKELFSLVPARGKWIRGN